MFNAIAAGAAASGFLLGGSLIVAIGAQNAFILRQGLARVHVLAVCLIASLADATLIAAGIAGLGSLVERAPTLLDAVRFGGAAFLTGYALLALRRALSPRALTTAGATADSLAGAVAACLALTFLNPHVYLDTVVLVGGLSAGYAGTARVAFGIGAAFASFAWFFALGFGARLLAPLFARPAAWRALDLGIAAVMAFLAAGLMVRFPG